MPGGNVCDENLEQRIERIRKRDEEIEKRHREAEADRLAALQANAMVKTTAPADDDWPKAHKYDKLDFTYDVKCEQTDTDVTKKPTDETRPQRPFKKFPEGQGPPSDPKFNFLADAERDGKVQGANVQNENKNWRANNNNSNNNSSSNNSNNRRNNSNNNSFNRGRNGGGKGGMGKSQADAKKGKSNDEPILRKNDRERKNEQRMQRQKSSDGMWRRPSDETKEPKKNVSNSPTGKSADNRQAATSNFDANSKAGANKPLVQQRMAQSQQIDSDNIQQQLSDLSIEKRGNIYVSVTKDGEVKSVKLEAARAIGSGRVGGISMRHNIQQQQQFVANTQHSVILDPHLGVSTMSYSSDLNYPTIDQFMPSSHTQQYSQQVHQVQPMTQMTYASLSAPAPVPVPSPAPPAQLPTVSTTNPMSNVINGTPFKLPSVQDRLTKNRVYFDENLKNVTQSGNGVEK